MYFKFFKFGKQKRVTGYLVILLGRLSNLLILLLAKNCHIICSALPSMCHGVFATCQILASVI
jgi:hypothetical protein